MENGLMDGIGERHGDPGEELKEFVQASVEMYGTVSDKIAL